MASTGEDPRLRNLRIKTGVFKREKAMYEKEVVDQEAVIEKLKARGEDEYVIRKQYEVLEESKRMVPDCERRLETIRDELQATLDTDKELVDSKEYKEAQELLKGSVESHAQ